jgi:hypothetical protein
LHTEKNAFLFYKTSYLNERSTILRLHLQEGFPALADLKSLNFCHFYFKNLLNILRALAQCNNNILGKSLQFFEESEKFKIVVYYKLFFYIIL